MQCESSFCQQALIQDLMPPEKELEVSFTILAIKMQAGRNKAFIFEVELGHAHPVWGQSFSENKRFLLQAPSQLYVNGHTKRITPYRHLIREPSSLQIAPARYRSVDKTLPVHPRSNDRDIQYCVLTWRRLHFRLHCAVVSIPSADS